MQIISWKYSFSGFFFVNNLRIHISIVKHIMKIDGMEALKVID